MTRIRKVLLDAFGTIFSPRNPVFTQYTQVALQFGLKLNEKQVKQAFKKAYNQWTASHPMYGKFSTPPIDPTTWWANVIHDTFLNAGVPNTQLVDPLLNDLTTTLISRFWSRDGYALHHDVLPFLDSLRALAVDQPPGVVSGSDPNVSKVLQDLDVLRPGRVELVTTTWDVGFDKRDLRFWEDVLRRTNDGLDSKDDKLEPDQILVVGDELVADYETPRKAGFQSLLLRRFSETGEHARASYNDETGSETGLDTVVSLAEVGEWIRRQQ
ncbi:HAD-like protein [Meredithblackwellia eburnea MCA 4105]